MSNYPPQPQPYPQQPPPDNQLVWAILATILCFWPTGIVAIIKATQVNTLWFQGQYAAAMQSAEEAKKWSLWSVYAAIAVWVLVFVVSFVLPLVMLVFFGAAMSATS